MNGSLKDRVFKSNPKDVSLGNFTITIIINHCNEDVSLHAFNSIKKIKKEIYLDLKENFKKYFCYPNKWIKILNKIEIEE